MPVDKVGYGMHMGQQHGLQVLLLPWVTLCVAHAMSCTVYHLCYKLYSVLLILWVVLWVALPITHAMCHTTYHLHHLEGLHTELDEWKKKQQQLTTTKLPVSVCCIVSCYCWCQHIPVAWTCIQNLISKEYKTVTYLITEPILRSRRKSKSQGVVAQKKQVTWLCNVPTETHGMGMGLR